MAQSAKRSLADATRGELALRRARIGLLQAQRLVSWVAAPARWQRPEVAAGRHGFPHRVYHREVPLVRSDPGVDPTLDRGKRVNVALAAPRFDGLVLAPDRPLSFWRALGRCTEARGFQPGMELRGGCIVPTIGGGICLLSNAIFRLACELGWTILERHGHTMEAAPPPADDPVWGLDATVLWPHVDLRVAPAEGTARLGMQVIGAALVVRVDASARSRVDVELGGAGDVIYEHNGERVRASCIVRRIRDRASGAIVREDVVAENRRRLLHAHEQRRSCITCGEEGCHARTRSIAVIRATPARGAGAA